MKTHCDCGRKLKHEDSIKEGICGVCKNSKAGSLVLDAEAHFIGWKRCLRGHELQTTKGYCPVKLRDGSVCGQVLTTKQTILIVIESMLARLHHAIHIWSRPTYR